MESIAPWHWPGDVRAAGAPRPFRVARFSRPVRPWPCGWSTSDRGWRASRWRWTLDLWWLPAPMSHAYYRVSREGGRQVALAVVWLRLGRTFAIAYFHLSFTR